MFVPRLVLLSVMTGVIGNTIIIEDIDYLKSNYENNTELRVCV